MYLKLYHSVYHGNKLESKKEIFQTKYLLN